jgi:protein-S-isoprenylcysteine O-methyltransferase Ste14
VHSDATFRVILVVGFVTVVLVTLYHRLQSWASADELDRRQEGVLILATLRPVALMLWLGVIAYMVNPSWMAWSSVPVQGWLRWTGVPVYGLAAALLTWTLGALGTNLTDTVVTKRAHTLVTRGPYRWVRHPFYDSMALLILAISLIAANWFLLLSGCVVILLLIVRTRTEEEKLLVRFGDRYRSYMRRTGRFVPKIRRTSD